MAGRNLFAEEPKGRNLFAEQPKPEMAKPDFTGIAEETSPLESAFIAGGRGLTRIGAALGLTEQESPTTTAAFEALQKQHPISTTAGEVVGESLPFLVPATGVGAIGAAAPRIAASIGLGAGEGGIISMARGEDEVQGAVTGGAIAGTLEAAFPVIGRLGSALVKKFKGSAPTGAVIDSAGRPTKELVDALDQAGMSFDDLTTQAVNTLKQAPEGVNVQQAARAAGLESLGAPATAGDITQDFAQQAAESRLVESAADKLGDPLRRLRLEQSKAFEQQLTSQLDSLGVPDEVGDSIKAALSGSKKMQTAEKNALYKQVADASDDVKKAPVITDSINAAIPDDETLADLAITAGEGAIEKVDDLLVKFGINRSPDDVERFVNKTFRGKPATIEPLTVGNIDRFRKSLNAIDDPTGALSVYTGPIKQALDEEAGLIDDALRASGVTDETIMGTLKQARAAARQLKTEFSPEAITGRLIKVKRDGVTPLVESSKVYNELMATNKAPELVERTIDSLMKTSKGKKAIGDLQAKTVVDLLDNAFKASTRKVDGERLFGATAFNKRLDQIGDRRLNAIFKTRPDMLKKIKQVGKVAGDIVPPSGAMPKGSASVILDALNRTGIMNIMSKTPSGAAFAGFMRDIVETGADRQALEKAMRAKPQIKKMATFIANEAPSLAAPLGIAFLATEEQ